MCVCVRLEGRGAAGISINGSDDSTAIIRRHRVSSMDCRPRVHRHRFDLLTSIREYSLLSRRNEPTVVPPKETPSPPSPFFLVHPLLDVSFQRKRVRSLRSSFRFEVADRFPLLRDILCNVAKRQSRMFTFYYAVIASRDRIHADIVSSTL